MTILLNMLGNLAGFLSAATLVLTVAAVPWILGGLIPLARLVLLTGAIGAAGLSLVASCLQRQLPRSLPILLIPLAGLTLLGMYQLRNESVHPARHMKHAVQQDIPELIPQTTSTASLLAADTRTMIGTLLALSLIAATGFDRIRSQRAIMGTWLVFVLNGVIVTTIGLTQLFQQKEFVLNKIWALGWNQGSGANAFSSFINPNNAAGWLCLCFACAAGWLMHLLQSSSMTGSPPGFSIWERSWRRSVRFIADLTIWQILAIGGIAFLGTGVAATQSRGGILALVTALVIAVGIKSSLRRLPVVLLLLVVCGGGVYGMLRWLDLDQAVIGEIKSLEDLNQAAGSRPQHWLDSLNAVRDFPLTGTGLGSYRFATLPYQTQFSTAWFRNADNHFVEMLVEGGLFGLLLFIAIGAIGLHTGFAGWKQQNSRAGSLPQTGIRSSRRFLGTLGTVAVLATLTQATAGFFDYGIGMPAAGSLLVLLIATCGGGLDHAESLPSVSRSGSMPCPSWIVMSIQLALLGAAVAFLPDQLAAARIDESVIAGHRILNQPDPDNLDRVEQTRRTLEARLRRRPDDPEGLRVLSRLASSDFRWRALLAANGQEVRINSGFSMIWKSLSIETMVDHIAQLKRQNAPAAMQLKDQLLALADEVRLATVLQSVQRQYALMPGIAETRSSLDALAQQTANFETQARLAIFIEPANSEIAFRLGRLALRCDKPEFAQQLWESSLRYSGEFQPAILTEAREHWNEERAMAMFGPKTYADAVRSALMARDPQLKKSLWKQADVFWKDPGRPADEETNSLHAAHLAALNQGDAAVAWLRTCINQPGDHLRLSRELARLLEKQAHYTDAVEQWHRILYLVPGDPAAEAAIARIRALK